MDGVYLSMAQFMVTVPDQEASLFAQMLKERSYAYAVETEDDYEIPEWQKEEVRKSVAETKQGKGIPWEEVKGKLFRER